MYGGGVVDKLVQNREGERIDGSNPSFRKPDQM